MHFTAQMGFFVAGLDETGHLKQRERRSLVIGNEGLLLLTRVKRSRYPNQAVEMRTAILEFVISEEGSVNW